jgi:RHS repeat-associated protein
MMNKALLEETQYYPFGLAMSGISSRAAGKAENKKKYNGIEYENSFDLNMGETFFRTHDPQLGRWWQIDPKPSYEISLYAAMDNNPISKADFLGDVAVFYNSQGEEIYRMKDGHKRITPTIIGNDNMMAFAVSLGHGKATAKGLQGLGITYDTKAFSAFYDKNSKAFKADYVGSVSLKNATSVTVDGKPVNKNSLYAEATANTVLKDGVVTVGKNPATSNGSMTGADPDKPGNEPGKTGNIHLHPTERTMVMGITKKYVTSSESFPTTIYGGLPSPGDHTEYNRSGQGTRYVMVDDKYIYLFNGDASQTIKVPRK